MKPYAIISNIKNLDEVQIILTDIGRQRDQDIREFNNLTNRFMRGRKVSKIPTSSSDVDDSDRVGDFNFDASYFYILVDNSGTNTWRRAALGTW